VTSPAVCSLMDGAAWTYPGHKVSIIPRSKLVMTAEGYHRKTCRRERIGTSNVEIDMD